MFHCLQVGDIDADVRRLYATRGEGWYNTSFLQADGEAGVLGCIREAADDVLAANSGSVMSSSVVFMHARRAVNTLQSVWKRM